jgi:hypothetical protein
VNAAGLGAPLDAGLQHGRELGRWVRHVRGS